MAGSFWNDKTVEPKRQFRWKIGSGNIGSALVWTVKSITKPVATVGEAKHVFFGYTYNFPGNVTWNDCSVTLVDPAEPDMVATLANLLQGGGYIPPTTSAGPLYSTSKLRTGHQLGAIKVITLDADGQDIETWEFVNPVLKSIDFGGTLAFDQEGLVELKLDFKYDWAKLSTLKGRDQKPIHPAPGNPSFARANNKFFGAK